MKLTTKGRYAVMAMADLAANQNNKPVSLTDISLRQNISQSYFFFFLFKIKKRKTCEKCEGTNWWIHFRKKSK